MHALFTSKLNHFPTDQCSRLLSSAKLRVQLPECLTSTSCLNKIRRPLSLYDQVHDRNPKLYYSRVVGSRALSSLDVSLECEKDDPKDEAFEVAASHTWEEISVISTLIIPPPPLVTATTVDPTSFKRRRLKAAVSSTHVKTFEEYIVYINKILSSIGDGRISVSPYDTAFVALIKDLDDNDVPQFPSSLEWIAENQLLDGSWGDEVYFCAFDRIVNTLACVVALKSWNIHGDKSEKGISYIKKNVSKLENANAEHMTCGFEVVFPALLQRAQNLGIEGIPYNDPVIREIYAARDQKLKRIPKEMLHNVPTSLLFSLEGLQDLDWEKLLKLQSTDGSFLTSPSSTAFAFMETKDQNCLKFIKNTIEIFSGGAPHTYPVDIFARLWAVDRLHRLGISRFFEPEIRNCLSYIYSFWTKNGVFSGRNSEFCDIDDTSMGFRLLRLHGYNVTPEVFKNFKNNDKFSCYGGQIIESPSPIYNLYRASQVLFPGEKILEEAKNFSYNFLHERVANNQVLDKWVISNHLADEISNGLNMPWYSSLPRVEARFYLEHYGGATDVWIGKTLYRMPDISNNAYLELGRLDFNRCQEQHQIEWTYMQEWYESICSFEEFGISREDLLIAYFLATASIFEPERSNERIAWAKSQIISKIITSFYNKETTSLEQKVAFLSNFSNSINGLGRTNSYDRAQGRISILLADALLQFLEGFEGSISRQLKDVWVEWLKTLHNEMANDAELLVTTLNICSGRASTEEILSHHEYKYLANLTNKICHRLSEYQNKKVNIAKKSGIKDMEIDEDMQRLVQLVLEESDGINRNTKQTFLQVAKTFYYVAYNDAEKIALHICKVLTEPVL
ncbi:hypothetical protein ACJIZ3_004353 [Penstemon smallii]|uniref:Terpene synthase N-terminal domain-containing protein n=1 Tax=Penstemon smallii TaxID=265156 RepID=A0ABD3S1V3_9LAMI